jgi:ring-1,2-phenylacetyl-CoA epoxidase subunit PaaC
VELFAEDELDTAMAKIEASRPACRRFRRDGRSASTRILAEATLSRPKDRPHSWHGKRGQHSEHLGYILTEMQHLQRTYPGARW